MDQHVAAGVVGVVGHHEARRDGALLGVQRLDDLRRLGPGRRAHVEHLVLGNTLSFHL